MMIDKIGGKKVLIYIVTVIIAIIASYLIHGDQYKTFLDFTLWLAIGFFVGNSVSHIASAIKKKNGDNIPLE